MEYKDNGHDADQVYTEYTRPVTVVRDRPDIDPQGSQTGRQGMQDNDRRTEGGEVTPDFTDIVRLGQPVAKKRPKPKPRRVNKSKRGVTNLPQEVLFNPTLTDLDVRLYALVKTLQWSTGWCYASQREMAKMIRDNPGKYYYKTIGTSLKRLISAGYIRKQVKRGKLGKRYEYQTVDLRKGKQDRQQATKSERIVNGWNKLQKGEFTQEVYDQGVSEILGRTATDCDVTDKKLTYINESGGLVMVSLG